MHQRGRPDRTVRLVALPESAASFYQWNPRIESPNRMNLPAARGLDPVDRQRADRQQPVPLPVRAAVERRRLCGFPLGDRAAGPADAAVAAIAFGVFISGAPVRARRTAVSAVCLFLAQRCANNGDAMPCSSPRLFLAALYLTHLTARRCGVPVLAADGARGRELDRFGLSAPAADD